MVQLEEAVVSTPTLSNHFLCTHVCLFLIAVRIFTKGGVDLSLNECPRYDIELADGEFGGMQSTPSLPSPPRQLWPRVITSGRVLSMGQIELFHI